MQTMLKDFKNEKRSKMNKYNIISKLKNKITLGDSLEILKLLPDKCIDLILTDPPYELNLNG